MMRKVDRRLLSKICAACLSYAAGSASTLEALTGLPSPHCGSSVKISHSELSLRLTAAFRLTLAARLKRERWSSWPKTLPYGRPGADFHLFAFK